MNLSHGLTKQRSRIPRPGASAEKGATLVEVLIASLIFAVVFGSILTGLIQSNSRTAWITTDAAASKLAEQRLEQTQNARWDSSAIPPIDEVTSNNFPSLTVTLDNSGGGGNAVVATSTVQVIPLPDASSLAYKVIRSQVTWMLFGRGPFTNTAITLRAPDQ
jgi:Flp pilus assembly protein TadG